MEVAVGRRDGKNHPSSPPPRGRRKDPKRVAALSDTADEGGDNPPGPRGAPKPDKGREGWSRATLHGSTLPPAVGRDSPILGRLARGLPQRLPTLGRYGAERGAVAPPLTWNKGDVEQPLGL
ncbi:hypothetical protein Sjap_002373 [Stephania japonica]|uniref:Uncharacterized protein n=1 Tax=Stephania japonica TaxID=461633 RepID=A0AAP0KNC9_9MAGN